MSVIFDNYTGYTPWAALNMNAANDWSGNSFTPKFTHSLESIDIYVSKGVGNNVGNIYVDLYLADAADKPTGASLASGIILDAAVLTTASWVNCAFSSPYIVTAGVKYVFIVHGPSLNPSNILYWSYDDDGLGGDDYPAGKQLWSVDGGSSWSVDATQDNTFRCWGTGDLYAVGLYGCGNKGTLSKWNEIDAWEVIVPKLLTNTVIYDTAVLNGKIYAGTNTGALLEWNGAQAWTEVAAPVVPTTGAVFALEAHNGKIYGSGGGKLLEWDGVSAWVEVAPQYESSIIGVMKSFNDKLYYGANTTGDGRLFEWNEVDAWVPVAATIALYEQILALEEHNGKLYGGTSGTLGAGLLEWNGLDAWTLVASKLNNQYAIHALKSFNSELFGGTYNLAELHRWNGVNAWTQAAGRYDVENYIYSLITFREELYGGSSLNGKLLKWDTVSAWTQVAPINNGETSIYSLIEFELAPVITDESTAQALLNGQVLNLFVTATADPAPTYQWYHDDIAIDGATSAVYAVVVSPAFAGNYKCVVTNVGGSVSTSQIPVTVAADNPYRINMFNLYLDHNELS